MHRERIVEEKKRLGISAKTMSNSSKLHITEETISRFLKGKTSDIGVNTFVDIAETVGLTPYEAFMDATLAAEFKVFLELKSKNEETESERIRIIAENESLKTTNAALANRIGILEMQLEHKEEIMKYLKDIIDLHNRYDKLSNN